MKRDARVSIIKYGGSLNLGTKEICHPFGKSGIFRRTLPCRFKRPSPRASIMSTPQTMQAVIFGGPRNILVEERSIPTVQEDGDAIVK
jgi:hypothetical protein